MFFFRQLKNHFQMFVIDADSNAGLHFAHNASVVSILLVAKADDTALLANGR